MVISDIPWSSWLRLASPTAEPDVGRRRGKAATTMTASTLAFARGADLLRDDGYGQQAIIAQKGSVIQTVRPPAVCPEGAGPPPRRPLPPRRLLLRADEHPGLAASRA